MVTASASKPQPSPSFAPVFAGAHSRDLDRGWTDEAIRKLKAETTRSADTHLYSVDLPKHWGIQLYLKDESTHRSGSLKHRLARSLFLYGLVNGWIRRGTTIVEASSGSTAVSEAYYASLLGLPYVAVMARSTSPEKISLIESFGGTCFLVDHPSEVYAKASQIAAETNGHYLDQFTYAERATDWRGNNNIAESIFGQLVDEPNPVPSWVVVGAGTGGTSATIGRYVRYHGHNSRLAVVDPENSAFYPGWQASDMSVETGRPSRIEGIGRPRVEPSFVPGVIDAMIPVPDAASIAAMDHLGEFARLNAGPSTGTNMWGVWTLISSMRQRGETGSIVTLMCDSGDRYACTYRSDIWRKEQGLDPAPFREQIQTLLNS